MFKIVHFLPERLEKFKLSQMGTHWVHSKGVLSWMVRWAQCSGTKDFCPALAALVSPVQNIFSLPSHYSLSFVPIAQQAGQAVMTRHLSLNMCLCFLSSLCPDWIAKTQYQKCQTNNPRKGIARLQSQFLHSCFFSDLYIPLIGLLILVQENRWTERGNI